MHANAERICEKETKADGAEGKWFRGNFQIFMESLQNDIASLNRKKFTKAK